jgi:hypothetical protein
MLITLVGNVENAIQSVQQSIRPNCFYSIYKHELLFSLVDAP